MKIMRILFVVIVICLTIGLSNRVVASSVLNCVSFDQWFLSDGGSRFDYRVVDGDWNLPSDIQQISTITLQTTGIWEYMSDLDQAKYFIVFLTFEPSGNPIGQHDICVYRLGED